MGFIVVASIAVFSVPAAAQAVNTDSLQGMELKDLMSRADQFKIPLLLVTNAMIIALLFAAGLMRPGGFEKAGLRDVKPLPAMVWMFAALVVFLAWNSAAGIAQQTPWMQDGSLTSLQQEVVLGWSGYIFGGVAGLGMLFVLHKSAPEAGQRLGPLDFAVGVGCFMLAYPFIELASTTGVLMYDAIQGGTPDIIAHPTLQAMVNNMNDPWSWALVAAAVLGAPLVEEIMWRVFVQSSLLRLTKSPWVSILLTSVAFAMMHRVGGEEARLVPWHALLPITALGITCGIAYERTKRVGVPIAMHMLFNAANVAMALLIAPEASGTGV